VLLAGPLVCEVTVISWSNSLRIKYYLLVHKFVKNLSGSPVAVNDLTTVL